MSAEIAPQRDGLDPILIGATLGLIVIGTIMVGSASISLADRNTGEPFFYLLRHLFAVGFGMAGLLVAVSVPTQFWYRMNWALMLLGMGLLAVVLVPAVGNSANGAERWLALGPLRFQASEPARLCLLMYLASYAVRQHADLAGGFAGFFKPMVVVALMAVLLLAEPDFGAAVVVTAASLGVLFVAGARVRDFLLAVTTASGALAALAFTSPYRLQRLTTFLDPWQHPFASGFQLTNSLIAIGRGEWLGVGLGDSVQKLFYLPEAHTDFVFAVLTEELGFVGATLVIVLFALIVYRALTMGARALRCGLPFAGLLSTGIGLMLGLEAFINIGVNTGLLPTKGLTLPLISYGRSSTVISLVALGLLMRVHRELTLAERQSARKRGGAA
jgi:cell division protein FtsW